MPADTALAPSSVQSGGADRARLYAWLIGVLAALFAASVLTLWVVRGNATASAIASIVLVLVATITLLIRELHRRADVQRHALEREVEQHSRLFETSLDLILITDRQGHFMRVSPSAQAILGHDPSDMIGRSAVDFVHPDDLDSTRNEMRLARRGSEIRNFETRYVHRDGRSVALTWTGVWSESEQRHFFIGRDMSEYRRLAEAERIVKETLAAVINASPVAIICLAPDRKVMVWSRAAEQIFGYTAEEAIGQTYMLTPIEHEPEFDRLFAAAMAGDTLRDVRVRRRRKDGSIVDISFDAAVLWHDGEIKGIAYALADITDRNALEQQLRQSQKLDAIGQLTGGVAHDFNNVLSVITGTIDILADGIADRPELAAIARLISQAADRGAELTSHLLAFARKQPLQPRKTDVQHVLKEAASLLRPTLGGEVEIEWQLPPDAWPAMVDPSQLVTAVLNLAVNARDVMPNGGKLTIETANVYLDEAYASQHNEVTPGPYVMVAVSDTGPGIPEAIREKVFEPFFTTKEVGRGTGLGLSMVYGFVKQSGGHIKLYSEVGHGTTFKIYLPRADANADEVALALATQEFEMGNETILLVEDDPTVRASVTVQLESLGYRTVTASNAQEALAIIDRGTPFDLLFTDVVMSGSMNGRMLAEEAAKRRTPLKVLFTSGFTEDAVIHHGRLDPGVLLLVKPYRKTELARMIRRALALPDETEPSQPGLRLGGAG